MSDSSAPDLSALLQPIRIGGMEIANRIAMAPMTVDYGNPDETPSDRQIAYYAERAKGGVGLIGVEVCSVDPKHRYQQHSLGLHSDEQIPGHQRLVDAIHAHGVKVQPQISHPGPESLAPFFEGIQPMGASVIRTETTKQACREVTLEEIEVVIEQYGDGARRAREAGYDGIELHAAHSYMMLGSFLSPLRNFRADEYAGHSFEGRTRLLFQVVENIREKVGADFPISIRISGFERESGGREINDTQRLAPMLEAAGVDCLHVSGGVGDANITQIITGPDYEPGYNATAAAGIRQVVDIPVMVVGQNMDPALAAGLVESGKADIVAMGRALLADPDLPNKVRSGHTRGINRCILCQDCVDIMTTANEGTGCAVNPRCGRERDFPRGAAAQAKKVVVIGGGPGGLAAAQYAAERGHHVTLVERQSELGGAFRFASETFPHNARFLAHLLERVESLGVEVELGREATPESIRALAPDAVIVATGGRFEPSKLAGADGENVVSGAALQELVGQARSGGGTPSIAGPVAIVGANLIGLELAEWLATSGVETHLLEPSRRLATPAGKKRRGDHATRLDRLGVPVNTGVHIEGISPEGVVLQLANGGERIVRASTVLVVDPPEADTALADQLAGVAAEVHAIGDCTGFGLSKKAVAEAMRVAQAL